MNKLLPKGYRLHDVNAWIDGMGASDRKTGSAYTFTDITAGMLIYDGKEMVLNGSSSKIAMGNRGTINTVFLLVKPTTTTQYLLDLDGGTHTITVDGGAVTATGWSSPTIYVNGEARTWVTAGQWHLICVTTATAFAASAVVVGNIASNFSDCSIAQVMLCNRQPTAAEVGQVFHDLFGIDKVVLSTIDKLTTIGGLTFYKDFTRGWRNGLDADYSLGSKVATYSSTSGVPTCGLDGYQATVANKDVLKYLIAGNRTAESETIVIKFTPTGDFANDGVTRYLHAVGTFATTYRYARKEATRTDILFKSNQQTAETAQTLTTTTPLDGVTYTLTNTCVETGNPNQLTYFNGLLESSGSSNPNTDFTGGWGVNTFFYIGAGGDGDKQFIGTIKTVVIFNRVLSATEVLALNGLM